MRIQILAPLGAIIASTAIFACSSPAGSTGPGTINSGTSTGGAASTSTGAGGTTTGAGGAQGGANTSAGGNSNPAGGASSAQGGAGGSNVGGNGTGGATGGANTGTATGGKAPTGGSGGVNTGGTSANNTATGGKSSTGGANTGTATGGKATGGSSTTGTATGGKATGGSSTTGTATGGTSATTGGTSATGGSSSGTRPKGYYLTSDWSVTSVDWHGCVWTGIDSTVSGTTTTISNPSSKDYMTGTADGGPYRLAGTVHNNYDSVAMVGFNLNEAIDGNADQCKYNSTISDGPPIATIPSSATGIAVNWTSTVAPPTSFRIQIQDVDGATNAAHRWCATITDAGGPSFVKFTDFYTSCWYVGVDGEDPGTQFNKSSDKIDAAVFLVPGTEAEKAPFDFTIIGFAPGTSKDDAPGPAPECGKASGTIGSTTASEAASMMRKKITASDCKEYILFNNNWGNPTGSTQTLDYTANSFTVKTSTGSGSGAPASFPSIYIGGNGDIAGGTYSTWANSGLPKQISAISSAQTTFTWSGKTSGNFNAAYDVWFSKSTPPSAGGYEDAISGFLMVWLYKPGGQVPIGSVRRQANIAGHNWDVWVGPRGNQKTGTDDSNRPVVSYVSKDGTLTSLTFDLKAFMDDAVSKGSADMSAAGTSQAFANSWYLTDVFAGFEAWTGGDIVGIKETFTCVIQ